MPDLTDFQLEVTRLFFSLPASRGFLLAAAGGDRWLLVVVRGHLGDTRQ
jgi:hypothetical protein